MRYEDEGSSGKIVREIFSVPERSKRSLRRIYGPPNSCVYSPRMMEIDERFMRMALREAGKAAKRGEVPIGAVLVDVSGTAVGRGANGPIAKCDPTAHAEIIALRKAAKALGNYRLGGTTLYATIEPCAMCLGALLQARVRRLVYGADDPKAGAVRSIVRFPIEKTNHALEIQGGILSGECGRILKEFFAAKRRRAR